MHTRVQERGNVCVCVFGKPRCIQVPAFWVGKANVISIRAERAVAAFVLLCVYISSVKNRLIGVIE